MTRAMDRRAFIATGASSALTLAMPGHAQARGQPDGERGLWLQLWQGPERPGRPRFEVFAAGVGGMLTASLIGGGEGICWAERLTDDEAFERTAWVEKSVKITDGISSNPRLKSPLDFLFVGGSEAVRRTRDCAVVVTVYEDDEALDIAVSLAEYCRKHYEHVDAIAVVPGTFDTLPGSTKCALRDLRALSDFAFIADDRITIRIETPDPRDVQWTYRAALAARMVEELDRFVGT